MTNGELSLTFCGAAGTVTGSRHLVRAFGQKVLLDCGLFQGLKDLRLRNWAPPPFVPRELSAVVLSHGHLDHSGYLPLLAREGFKGPIHCTSGTADLLGVVLRDSAHLQEEDAARANRYTYSKHKPALPLYTLKDAERALSLVQPHRYGKAFDVGRGVKALFRRASHILGAATVELDLGDSPLKLVFSGDLGRWDRPILRDPELVAEADVLLLESTYGDRVHAQDPLDQLARAVSETAARGGVVVVLAFTIGRTQELLWMIRKLERDGRLPLISVFVDSPMALAVTEIYARHPEEHDLDMKALEDAKNSPLVSGAFHPVRTAAESKELNGRHGPMIIIAGNGMATGGRVLHHLKFRLPDHRNTVLLPGYQAAGTRGRLLQEGAREVKIHGEQVPVRAQVVTIDGLSAHADQNELIRWLGGFTRPPKKTWLVHGEARSANTLAEVIHGKLGWDVEVAVDQATVSLL